MEKVKASKLTFKGENPEKKKKKRKHEKGEDEEELSGWTNAENIDDLIGPIYIVTVDRKFCLAVASNETSLAASTSDPIGDKLILQHVTQKSKPDQQQEEGANDDLEPDQVSEVFIGQLVTPTTLAIKTHKSHCLTCDKFGIVTAETEAVGSQEEWTPIFKEDGVAFQSAMHQGFLKADVDKGGLIRADSESIGFRETFLVKCQVARKKAKKRKQEGPVQKSMEELEIENLKKTQTWGMNRLKKPSEAVDDLKTAAAQGSLYEAMLDRRSKIKSDKFCK